MKSSSLKDKLGSKRITHMKTGSTHEHRAYSSKLQLNFIVTTSRGNMPYSWTMSAPANIVVSLCYGEI